MDPSKTSRMDGSPKMNATAILSLKNDLTSTPPRPRPSRQALGSRTAVVVVMGTAAAGGAPLVLWGMTGLRDQFEVHVFERRPGDGQAGHLAVELPAQLRAKLSRGRGLDLA